MHMFRSQLLALFVCATASNAVFAKGGAKQFQGILSLDYNTPMPSGAGLNFGFEFSRIVRLTGGFGAYVRSEDSIMTAYGVGLVSTMGYVMTFGQIPYARIYDFFGGNSEGWESVMTSGLNATIFVLPGREFSPAVGVGYSEFTATDGAYGVLEAKKYYNLYYSAGIDWLSQWLHLKLGAHYAPQLPSKLKTSVYVGIGAML